MKLDYSRKPLAYIFSRESLILLWSYEIISFLWKTLSLFILVFSVHKATLCVWQVPSYFCCCWIVLKQYYWNELNGIPCVAGHFLQHFIGKLYTHCKLERIFSEHPCFHYIDSTFIILPFLFYHISIYSPISLFIHQSILFLWISN